MDPPSYTVEAFPLNGGEALPTHTPGPPMVPYTTVVNMSRERPPRDHIIWSLLSFLYCFPCCLGLAAVIYSVKARDSKMRGDFRSAVHHGAIARNINIGAIILFLILVGVIIYLFFYQPAWTGAIANIVFRKWI